MVLIFIVLFLLLLLLLLCVTDLHDTPLLAREEQNKLVIDVTRKTTLFKLLLNDVVQQFLEQTCSEWLSAKFAPSAPLELVAQDVRENPARQRVAVAANDFTHEPLLMSPHLARKRHLHFLEEHIYDFITVVELILAEVEEGDECLINGGEVPYHFAIAIADVELPSEGQLLDVTHTTALCNIAFVNGKVRLVHGTRASHGLPDLAEIIDIMCKHSTLEEEGLSELTLIYELERYVFANDVPIVDEKEYLFTKRGVVALTKIFVELLIELHIVVGIYVEHSITSVGLINMIYVPELFCAEMAQNEFTDIPDGRLLEDATQVNEHIKTASMFLLACLAHKDMRKDLQFFRSAMDEAGRDIFDEHVVVGALELSKSLFELLLGKGFTLVDIKAAVNQIWDAVPALVPNVSKGRVVVNEGGACEAYTIKVEHNVDGID
mmetsp:Transcript_12727/g.21931  ORF Transcript_12727/g.21931 Transcript_12727/m.21931 type:complete len:435 (+) Transcript_12727:954-2258(+)